MTPTVQELTHDIAEEKKRIGAESHIIEVAQKRGDKFRKKHEIHKRQLAGDEKHHRPKKVELDHQRIHRDSDKIQFWHRRELDAIELEKGAKKMLQRLVNQKHELQIPQSVEVLKHELAMKGVHETAGPNWGGEVEKMIKDLGYTTPIPWCSVFQAFNIKHTLGLSLPPNPAYSGSWLEWKHGERINKSQAQAGDLLIFDWGDGGLTDHVGMYMGHGQYISGNHGDAVSVDTVPWGNVVAVVRITN